MVVQGLALLSDHLGVEVLSLCKFIHLAFEALHGGLGAGCALLQLFEVACQVFMMKGGQDAPRTLAITHSSLLLGEAAGSWHSWGAHGKYVGLVVDLVMREQSKYELTLLNIWVSDLRFERTAGEVKLYLFIFIKPVFTGEYSCTGIGWIFCRWVWICLSVCLDNIRDKLSHGSFGSSTAKDTQISRIIFLCFRND